MFNGKNSRQLRSKAFDLEESVIGECFAMRVNRDVRRVDSLVADSWTAPR